MKKLDLAQSLRLLANAGVIAGIVFLAIELRQNNELMEAEARFNRLSIQTGSNTLLAGNTDLAQILAKANRNEELTDAEQLQARNFNVRVLSNMQWTFREVPESEVPVELWRSLHKENLHRRVFWESQKTMFNQDFVEFYEKVVQ